MASWPVDCHCTSCYSFTHCTVHDIGSLAQVATGCMALAILVCLGKLLSLPGSAFVDTSLLPPPDATFTTVVVALMSKLGGWLLPSGVG